MRVAARPSRTTAVGLTLIAVMCGTGCVSPLARSVGEQRLRDSGEYRIVAGLDVPAVRGVEGCGSQALAAVLAYQDPALDTRVLAEELPWHQEGATPVDLLLTARQRGFRARIAHGTWAALAGHVRQDEPLLVMFDAAPEVWTPLLRVPTLKVMHWSVVSGIGLDDSQVLLAARDHRHHVVPREDFLRRWSRSANCMILVSRKSHTAMAR